MGFVFPPHEPEDHRQMLFGNLGDRYGTEEEQRKAELWLSVSVDECSPCAQRLVWRLAKDVGAVVVLSRIFKLLVTFTPPPEENDAQLLELLRTTSVQDRAELVTDIWNDFAAARGGHQSEHGPECEGCADRRERWDEVRRRASS